MRKITKNAFAVVLFLAFSVQISNSFVGDGYLPLKVKIKPQKEVKRKKREDQERELMLLAFMIKESSNGVNTYNESEDAVGYLQIRPIMVKEVNLLVGYEKYTLEDRWDKQKSIEMFTDYQNAVNPTWDLELAAKKWNGGRQGHLKGSTQGYYLHLVEIYDELTIKDTV